MNRIRTPDLFSALPGPRGVERARLTRRFFGRSWEALGEMAERYGDVSAINIAGNRLVNVARPEWIDQILRDADGMLIKDRVLRDLHVLLGQGLLTSENPLWLRQRRLIAPALQRRHVLGYAQAMRTLTREMMAGWHDGQDVDVHAQWSTLTLRIVVQTLFNTQVREAEEAVAAALEQTMLHMDRELHSPLGLLPPWVHTPSRRAFQESIQVLDRVVLQLIESRRASGLEGDDLLGRLMAARDDQGEGMSNQQLRDEVLTLFLAGHETTALTMTWTHWLLHRRPDVVQRLREEITASLTDPDDLSPFGPEMAQRLPWTLAVLRESMRLYPPAWIVGREPVETVEVGPHRVPPGAQLLMCTWNMHRDGRWFDQPDAFLPERWLDGLHERLPRGVYLPFGGGPRICIGNHFAMMEAAILLTEVVREWDFVVEPGYQPELVPSVTMRPRHGMPGRLWKRRHHGG
jgi:cytochrome P450